MPQRKVRKGRQKVFQKAKNAKISPSIRVQEEPGLPTLENEISSVSVQTEYPVPRLAWSLRPS